MSLERKNPCSGKIMIMHWLCTVTEFCEKEADAREFFIPIG